MCKKRDGVIFVDPYRDEPPIELRLTLPLGELMTRKKIVLGVEVGEEVPDVIFDGKEATKK